MSGAAHGLLEVDGLGAGYGRKQVVFDASFSVAAGEVVVLLGHNGAGKSTVLRAVHGLLPARSGTIRYGRQEITGRSVQQNVADGVAFMASERFVFDDLTVSANLDAAALPVPRSRRRAQIAHAQGLFPVLAERSNQLAGTLSGGQKRMLSTAMLLSTGPRLLLLDEPSLGLAPAVVDQLFGVLRSLCDREGLGILLVEQNVGQALRIADRVVALRAGRIMLVEDAAVLRQRTEFWDLF
ncbi:MAG: ABC transporter ATP-binding protein [Kineosporiaceae bacterium]